MNYSEERVILQTMFAGELVRLLRINFEVSIKISV